MVMIGLDQRLSCCIQHDEWKSRKAAIEWCLNNIGLYNYTWKTESERSGQCRYYFKNKEDLVKFKLVWL